MFPAIAARAEITPDSVRIQKLDSGLTVFVARDENAPQISVQLWFKVGSAYEAADEGGICELVRRGLNTEPAGESAVLRDACYFSTLWGAGRLDEALRVERARLTRTDFTTDDLKHIPNSATANRTDADGEEMLALLFKDHPYGRAPGALPTTNALLAPEVNQFRRTWFVPGNAALFVIGNVEIAATHERIRNAFDGLKWAEPPRAPEPSHATGGFQVFSRAAAEKPEHVEIAWVTPGLGLLENSGLDVLMHRLCNPIDGPLARAAREAGADLPTWRRVSWRHSGAITLTLPILNAERARATDWPELVKSALQSASTAVATPVELNRARTQTLRRAWEARTGFEARARLIAEFEIIGGDWVLMALEVERIRRVTGGELQMAADRLLDAKAVCVLPPGFKSAGEPRVSEQRTPTSQPTAEPETFRIGDRLRKTSSQLAVPLQAPSPDAVIADAELREIQDEPLALIRLTTDSPTPHVRGVVRHGNYRGWSADQLADFLNYRGITLNTTAEQLDMVGPADELTVMAEILAELLRTGADRMPDKHKKTITVVAPFKTEQTGKLIAPLLHK